MTITFIEDATGQVKDILCTSIEETALVYSKFLEASMIQKKSGMYDGENQPTKEQTFGLMKEILVSDAYAKNHEDLKKQKDAAAGQADQNQADQEYKINLWPDAKNDWKQKEAQEDVQKELKTTKINEQQPFHPFATENSEKAQKLTQLYKQNASDQSFQSMTGVGKTAMRDFAQLGLDQTAFKSERNRLDPNANEQTIAAYSDKFLKGVQKSGTKYTGNSKLHTQEKEQKLNEQVTKRWSSVNHMMDIAQTESKWEQAKYALKRFGNFIKHPWVMKNVLGFYGKNQPTSEKTNKAMNFLRIVIASAVVGTFLSMCGMALPAVILIATMFAGATKLVTWLVKKYHVSQNNKLLDTQQLELDKIQSKSLSQEKQQNMELEKSQELHAAKIKTVLQQIQKDTQQKTEQIADAKAQVKNLQMDTWSAGNVLYQMINGKSPFSNIKRDHPLQLIQEIEQKTGSTHDIIHRLSLAGKNHGEEK